MLRQTNQFISENCSLFLSNISYQKIIPFETLSAIGVNKVGKFHECLNDEHNSYYLIRGAFNTTSQFISGLCFDSNCRQPDLIYIFNAFKSYVPIPIQLHDIILHTKQQIHLNGVSLAFFIILAFLGLILLVATYMDWKNFKPNSLIVRIFSIWKLLDQLTIRQPKLMIISGLRLLMFLGIIVMHEIKLMANLPTLSLQVSQRSLFSCTYILVYCIDVWFMISGFFLSFSLLQQFSIHKSVKTHIRSILMRIVLIWPVYMVGLLITWALLPNYGFGPIYPLLARQVSDNCNQMVMYDAFLISNFFPKSCNPTLWYYQAEIQLSIIFTFILIIYIKSYRKYQMAIFITIQIIMALASIIYPILADYHAINTRVYISETDNGYWKTPLSRVCVYMMGFNLGVLYYRMRKLNKMQCNSSGVLRILGNCFVKQMLCIVPILLMGSMIIYLYFISTKDLSESDHIIFTIGHIIIPLAVLGLIIRPLFGYNNTFKKFLTIKIFVYLSRIVTSSYIIHHVIQVQRLYSVTTDIYTNGFAGVFYALCIIPETIVWGLILALLVQLPVSLFRNHFFPHYYSYM